MFIISMLGFMASFFLIMYLLSIKLFNQIGSGIQDMNTVFNRLQCSQNVLIRYTELYFNGASSVSQELSDLT